MRHVNIEHDGHPNTLYDKCYHGDLTETKKWIKVGSKPYQKLKNILTKTTLVKDIKKLSPVVQTSSLEGFHSVLNHWHPKMICFSWLGTYCRHILACLHFNENVHRETKTSKTGTPYIRVTYPKFKLGEEMVREIAVPATYGYVDEMCRELLHHCNEADLNKTYDKAKEPNSLTSQFSARRTKEEAIRNQAQRKGEKPSYFRQYHMLCLVETQDHLITKEKEIIANKQKKKRKAPCCKKCGEPMKGHQKDTCQSNTAETGSIKRICSVRFADKFGNDKNTEESPQLNIEDEMIVSLPPCPSDPQPTNENENHVVPPNPKLGTLSRNRAKPAKYLEQYVDSDEVDENNHINFTVDYCCNISDVLKTYQEAISSPHFPQYPRPMEDEMYPLRENDTFELTTKPENRNTVGGRWVYAIKTDPNGEEKYKARFVAKGYLQIPGVDYHETFSPTARMTSIRILMQLVVQYNLTIHQMDVKTAYLNAPIDCELYVEQPEGFTITGKDGKSMTIVIIWVDDNYIKLHSYANKCESKGPLISWESRKQPTVALSTCTAEYMSLASAVQEGKFLSQLLEDTVKIKFTPVTLHCDNQGALALEKTLFSTTDQNILIYVITFLRSEVQRGLLHLFYVTSKDNLADIFTKPISGPRIKTFVPIIPGVST
ncbi:Hypothetical predicted protein [Paramuricea clavata]|uniref:Uncharacterized protein n=1 Tax=Paramuricea clavata TaxID=317549 RepID=A0A6S7FZL2_PARCT|nr:Hypothetical predicted protein [Paramuricea clavata]